MSRPLILLLYSCHCIKLLWFGSGREGFVSIPADKVKFN